MNDTHYTRVSGHESVCLNLFHFIQNKIIFFITKYTYTYNCSLIITNFNHKYILLRSTYIL